MMRLPNPLKLLFMVGLTLVIWSLDGVSSAIAAPAPAAVVYESPAEAIAIDDTLIDDTLKAIPPGFYGILKTDQLKAKIATEDPLLVDVREPSEFLLGHIPGAVNLPLRSLGDHLADIPRDRPVVLYCSTGYRTGLGVMALHLWGYDNVQGYPPSYQGWLRDTHQ